jgi:predicted RNA binding protein YcfA (HicA-like mRNA interferase family)/predicted RNase H-like HicB family nuclease
MKVRDVLKLFENDGSLLARMRGSHGPFKHPRKSGLVTVAGHPSVDLPKGTLNNIFETSRFEGLNSAMRHTVVIEEGSTSFGAHVPDLPGCIAAGEPRAEVMQLIREAIEFHLEEPRDQGAEIPVPHKYRGTSRGRSGIVQ